MKSNMQSYRVKCDGCGRIMLVGNLIMDTNQLFVYCPRCHTKTTQKKID